MKKIYRLLLLTWIIVPSLCGAAQHKPMPQAIQKIMQRWLSDKLPRSHIGIVVQSMKTGKILYQRNVHHLFTPASVQKLLTAVAALDYLKPHFIFKTQLLTQGKIVHHVLKGDLILKFSGDPTLTQDDLEKLITQLHKQGIQKITGHIHIDATDYGNVPYPPGWIWDDLSYSFAAPLMTTIINRNYFTLILKTPRGKQTHPIISTNLLPGVVDFSNEVRVVKHTNQNCPLQVYSNANNHYRLRGCYYYRWKQQVRKIAIRDMPRYTKVLLAHFLKENHIAYHGPIAFKSVPKNTDVIAEHASPPLSKIIKKMIKDSDNLMTNAVLKKIGAHYFRERGTWKNSLRALKRVLSGSAGIDFKTNLINDGAGLSRYNLITPRQLSKLLYFAYHNEIVKNPLIKALPVAGRDGTMAYRLQDQRKEGRIHMKTGTMTGVTALAGYIRTKHIGDVALIIMVNGFVKPRKPYIGMEDDICRYLVNVTQPAHKPGKKALHLPHPATS